MRYKNAIESRKKHIKNLSNEQLTDEQITLLSRGLKFIPTPVTTENNIRRKLLKDFDLFARRMRLQYIYYGKEREPHPFHVKSDWNPPSPAFRGFRNLPGRSEIKARRDSI